MIEVSNTTFNMGENFNENDQAVFTASEFKTFMEFLDRLGPRILTINKQIYVKSDN